MKVCFFSEKFGSKCYAKIKACTVLKTSIDGALAKLHL